METIRQIVNRRLNEGVDPEFLIELLETTPHSLSEGRSEWTTVGNNDEMGLQNPPLLAATEIGGLSGDSNFLAQFDFNAEPQHTLFLTSEVILVFALS